MPETETETTVEEEQRQQVNDAANDFKTVLLQTLRQRCKQDNWADHGRTIGVSLPLQNLAEWGTWAIDFQFASKGKEAPYCAMLRFEMKEDTNLESCLRGLQLFYLYNKNDQSPEWSTHNNWNLKLFVEYHETLKRNNWQNITPNDLAKWIIVQKESILQKMDAQPDIHNLLDNEPSENARRDAAKWYLKNKGEYNEDMDTEALLNIYKRIKNDLNATAKNLRNKQADGKTSKEMKTYNDLWYFTLDKIGINGIYDKIDGMINVCGAEYNGKQLFCYPCKNTDKYFCDYLKWIRAGIATIFAETHSVKDIETFFACEEKTYSDIFQIKEAKIRIDTGVNLHTGISNAIDAFNHFNEKQDQFKVIFKYPKKDAASKREYMEQLLGEGNIQPYKGELKKNEGTGVSNKTINNSMARNRIIFGAPGTGKSHTANLDANALLLGARNDESPLTDDDKKTKAARMERVTFHPEYSYFDFVGSYKPLMINVPVMYVDGGILKTAEAEEGGLNTERKIEYDFVPGPFTRILVKALKDKEHPHLLLIEEINRARVAAVFGDIFQLLDRTKEGESEYSICLSEDLKAYLKGQGLECDELKLPSNLYIWATMNSADQGVYPLDTAFKRRWSMEYLKIDEGEEEDKWNTIRKGINTLLKSHVNEDKLMGYYFLKPEERTDAHLEDSLKGKVLMYLFDDAAKPCRKDIFKDINKARIYSDLRAKLSLSEPNLGIFDGAIFWPEKNTTTGSDQDNAAPTAEEAEPVDNQQ